MEDHGIIQLYLSRDEKALEETGMKYGAYCHSLAAGILKDEAEAQEVVNDTWLRAWNAIPPKRPVVLKLFLAKITRNLALNRLRDKTARRRGGGEAELALEELNECVPDRMDLQEALEGKELARAIRNFLLTRSPRDRSIFVRRYFSLEPVDGIAVQFGLSQTNVRKILLRTRSKLKDYLQREGYTV